MRPILLIDFGSTWTKVTAVDAEAAELLGTAAAATTAATDISEGLKAAPRRLEEQTGRLAWEARYACSSAAGGLRMIASDLVPDLTAKAAAQACLGAGAKVIRTYAYKLTEADVAEIGAAAPDIFLLCGGTDGGNEENLLHNARMLADGQARFPILLAGNRNCAKACMEILEQFQVICCENVMPQLGKLNITSVQEEIRKLFLKNIIQARGLTRVQELTAGILMPTPAAVQQALELLAEGCEGEPGIGELMAVDPGGATTDVYSIASGLPETDNTILKGLAEPYVKRTVEGDIGMRWSADGIVRAAGAARVYQLAGLKPQRGEQLLGELSSDTKRIPDTEEMKRLDHVLACLAVEQGVLRHAGTVEEVYTPMGLAYGQEGKDLRRVRTLVLTGGAIIHDEKAAEAAAYACYDYRNPVSLRPEQVNIWLDQYYILAAMGLLAEQEPLAALKIMKKTMKRLEKDMEVNHGTGE